MSGVEITKGLIGGNTIAGSDKTSGLIATAVAIVDKLDYGVHHVIRNMNEAAALGINVAYDTTNKVRLFHHVSEFFRIAGEGVALHLMIVEQSKTMVELLEDETFAKKLINEADGAIRKLAVSLNPASDYVESSVDGINSDVRAAIAKAQTFAEWCYNNFRPLNIFLEGRAYSGTAATALDLKKIPDTPAPKVCVVIGQDYNYAKSQDVIGQKYASVGNILGCSVKGRVNQNLGENENMNITDAGRDAFMLGGLSSHTPIKDVESDWSILEGKGYLFPIREIGLSGLRWNNDYTCVEQIVDADGSINEHTVAYGATIDKAARLLRTALLPKVKTVQPVDPETGLLPIGVVKYFEGLGDTVFENMVAANEISEGKTTVDAASNLLTGEKALGVSFEIVPYGTINKIKGVINLKNSL
ncbi:MAG: hypothetical protein COC06_07565 [Bacteroidales bacterium]|nr:MAG: hypothetical protein COC06_07565 [Bacteroidales bacterium]